MLRVLDDCLPGISTRLERGIDVLDVGAGRTLVELAARFPASRFFGYETRDEALEGARREIGRRRLANITVMRQDVASLPDRNAYDLVTAFDALYGQDEPAKVLANLRRALRRRGAFLLRAMAGDRALALLVDCGFSRIAVRRHPCGNTIYYVAPKPAAADD